MSLKEKSSQRKRNKILTAQKLSDAAFSILLMDDSVTACRNLIVYIGAIFIVLKIFKRFFLDLTLEAVDILGEDFRSDCRLFLLRYFNSIPTFVKTQNR